MSIHTPYNPEVTGNISSREVYVPDTPSDTHIVKVKVNPELGQKEPYIIPSLAALQKYGIPKSTAIYIIQNHWYIHTYRNILQRYFLLHWDISYFLRKLKEGKIEKDSLQYTVFYYKCSPYTLSHCAKGTQIKLSFRHLQKEYAATPVVLVTV